MLEVGVGKEHVKIMTRRKTYSILAWLEESELQKNDEILFREGREVMAKSSSGPAKKIPLR